MFLRNQFGLMGGLLVLSAFLAGLGMVLADPPSDPLELSRKERELKANKLLTLVNSNFEEAKRYVKTDPEKAQAILRQSRLLLEEDDIGLEERQRADLKKQIEDRLRDINSQVLAYKLGVDKAATRAEFEKNLYADLKKLDREITPYHVVAATIKQKQDEIKAQKDKEKAMKEAYQAWLDRMSGKSQPSTETGFDKGAVSKTALKLTEQEIALLKALNSTMAVDFKGRELRKVLAYIEKQTEGAVTILPDDEEITKKKIDLDNPVSIKGNKLTVRTILHKILREQKLDYYIEDAIVNITSLDKAEKQTVKRRYPIGDLISIPSSPSMSPSMPMNPAMGGMNPQMQMTPQMQQLQRQLQMNPQMQLNPQQRQLLQQMTMMQKQQGQPNTAAGAGNAAENANIEALADLLANTVDLSYWATDKNPNAPGKISYFATTKAFTITASQEVHYLVAHQLDTIRYQKATGE